MLDKEIVICYFKDKMKIKINLLEDTIYDDNPRRVKGIILLY